LVSPTTAMMRIGFEAVSDSGTLGVGFYGASVAFTFAGTHWDGGAQLVTDSDAPRGQDEVVKTLTADPAPKLAEKKSTGAGLYVGIVVGVLATLVVAWFVKSVFCGCWCGFKRRNTSVADTLPVFIELRDNNN